MRFKRRGVQPAIYQGWTSAGTNVPMALALSISPALAAIAWECTGSWIEKCWAQPSPTHVAPV